MWDELNRKIWTTSVCCIFSQIIPALDVILNNKKNFRYQIVWEKSQKAGFLDAKIRPLRAHELILVFIEKFKTSTYNPQKYKSEKKLKTIMRKPTQRSVYNLTKITHWEDDGFRYPHDIVKFKNGKGGRIAYILLKNP